MASLALPSLEIQRFRGFQDLRIEKLGRVNLIVGKNNIGKSSLLEAIQLYATKAHPAFLWQILAAHDEDRGHRQFEEALSSVKYLFYGRKDITGPTDPINIGPINNLQQQLRISIDFYRRISDKEGRTIFQILQPDGYSALEDFTLRFSISLGTNFKVSYSLESPSFVFPTKGFDVVSIEAHGLEKQKIAQLWDKITLTNHEQAVLKALRIVAPGIEGINIVGTTQHERTTIVKVQGIPEPLPISSLGDGMQRMLGIALALVNAQNGILLIDEIENGLHYSIQEDLWTLVFQIAHRLNVQVFATTHS